jgi:hypothetical protein
MMTRGRDEDHDIYASAQLLILQHGADAKIHATMKADVMLEAGDLEGQAVWKRVIKAIEQIQKTEKPANAS